MTHACAHTVRVEALRFPAFPAQRKLFTYIVFKKCTWSKSFLEALMTYLNKNKQWYLDVAVSYVIGSTIIIQLFPPFADMTSNTCRHGRLSRHGRRRRCAVCRGSQRCVLSSRSQSCSQFEALGMRWARGPSFLSRPRRLTVRRWREVSE